MNKKFYSLNIIKILCIMLLFTSCTKIKPSVDMQIINNAEIAAENSRTLGLVSPNNEIRKVSKETVLKIKQGMTYEEIIKVLGPTKDVGSGVFVAQYIVDEKLSLTISFINISDKCALSGEELLKRTKDN